MLDMCVLYGDTILPPLEQLLARLFAAQPKYADMLTDAFSVTLQALAHVDSQLRAKDGAAPAAAGSEKQQLMRVNCAHSSAPIHHTHYHGANALTHIFILSERRLHFGTLLHG